MAIGVSKQWSDGETSMAKPFLSIAVLVFLSQLVAVPVNAQSDWKRQWEGTVEAAKIRKKAR
jgi:hypothetical protein